VRMEVGGRKGWWYFGHAGQRICTIPESQYLEVMGKVCVVRSNNARASCSSRDATVT